MRFGTWIRAHRLRQGLSLDRVCSSVNLSKAYLSLIENALKGPPKDEIIVQIARTLGLDEEDLIMRAHREQYPEDVLELRRLTIEMRQAYNAVKDGLPEAAGQNGGGMKLQSPHAQAALDTMAATVKGLERLIPVEPEDSMDLISELDELRAEEREFALEVIRGIKQLRPRRGAQVGVEN